LCVHFFQDGFAVSFVLLPCVGDARKHGIHLSLESQVFRRLQDCLPLVSFAEDGGVRNADRSAYTLRLAVFERKPIS
jgi:hypothetical protein